MAVSIKITPPTSTLAHNHPDYTEQFDHWEMMADLYTGTSEVKSGEKAVKYLPPTEIELREGLTTVNNTSKKSRYQMRLERAVFLNGVDRLTKYAMSHLFRDEVRLPETKKPEMEALFRNADMLGTNLRQFIRNVSNWSYVLGHYFIVVDMPDHKPESAQEQRDLGLRPYFVAVDPRDIIDWQISKQPDGTFKLDWVVHRQTYWETQGPFQPYKQRWDYKVWYPDRWELYSHDVTSVSEPHLVREGINELGEIPVVAVYSAIERPMVSRPPLLEAGYLNVDHYRTYSSFNNGLMYHLNPLLVFTGILEEDQVKLNASLAVNLPKDADAKYVEYQGGALAIAQKAAEGLAQEVMESGLRQTSYLGANTSGSARQLSRSDFKSHLTAVAGSLEHGLQEAMRLAGKWIGVDLTDEETTIKLSRDYDIAAIDANTANFLLKARAQGDISKRTFLTELQRGEVLNKAINVDQEIKDAERDGPSDTGLTAAQLRATGKNPGPGGIEEVGKSPTNPEAEPKEATGPDAD